jgi:hypothetical protein
MGNAVAGNMWKKVGRKYIERGPSYWKKSPAERRFFGYRLRCRRRRARAKSAVFPACIDA